MDQTEVIFEIVIFETGIFSQGTSSSANIDAVNTVNKNLILKGRNTEFKMGSWELIAMNGQALGHGTASTLRIALKSQDSGVYFIRISEGLKTKVYQLMLR